MKRITILLMILLSVTGLTFAEQIGPVLDQPVVQQDLFAGIDAPEMMDEEMAEVEGEGVASGIVGAIVSGGLEAADQIVRSGSVTSVKKIVLHAALGGAAAAATGGASLIPKAAQTGRLIVSSSRLVLNTASLVKGAIWGVVTHVGDAIINSCQD